LQSQAELKESESLEVLDEVTIPDALIVKEEISIMSTDPDQENDNDEFDTPMGQTPIVDSSVGTPAESLFE
jgi:hypothetical protein